MVVAKGILEEEVLVEFSEMSKVWKDGYFGAIVFCTSLERACVLMEWPYIRSGPEGTRHTRSRRAPLGQGPILKY